MRNLSKNDKCYKFFYANTKKKEGPCSIKYKANTAYSDAKGLFFFRRDEVESSIKYLLYFMGFGDMVAEILVDQELLDNAIETSPVHFTSKFLQTKEIYDFNSVVVLELVLETLRKCNDFSVTSFKDVLIKLIQAKGFDSALIVYDTICSEKEIILEEADVMFVMEHGRQPWCKEIPLNTIRSFKTFKEYISFMKSLNKKS